MEMLSEGPAMVRKVRLAQGDSQGPPYPPHSLFQSKNSAGHGRYSTYFC